MQEKLDRTKIFVFLYIILKTLAPGILLCLEEIFMQAFRREVK